MKTAQLQRPMRVLFLLTSMPVGGAETLLLNLVRRMNRRCFAPEIICLKERGPLGVMLASEMPVHSGLLSSKYDLRVLFRLAKLMRSPRADAVVTIGAGDKMFWGRIAARLAGVPVVASALHSTGWPDSIGRLNRRLTRWTDAFIGVADAHAIHLVKREGFPDDKVFTIYNGIDTDRFRPGKNPQLRQELGIPIDAPVVGILAALRPEKNHEMFLTGAAEISRAEPGTHFLIIGDGPRRGELEQLAVDLDIAPVTHFLGSRDDVPDVLRAIDVVALTSHNEASPVSILEALSTGIPVVASRVGSVPETVVPDETGKLFAAGDLDGYVQATLELLRSPLLARELGDNGRQRTIEHRSLDSMVAGYEMLLSRLYQTKQQELRSVPAEVTKKSKGVPASSPS